MIVQNIYGVDEDFRTIRIPSQAQGRRLSLGALKVFYPTGDSVEIQSAFPRTMNVVFPEMTPAKMVQVTCNGKPLPSSQAEPEGNRIRFKVSPGRTYRASR
jgi:hypothetical protein